MKKYISLIGAISIITVIFGTIYVVSQQALRLNANDPQIQIAHDLAPQVTGNRLPSAAGSTNVDIKSSLAPFVIIYDQSGQPVAGTGYLHGQLPQIPKGVLSAAQHKSDNRVTWQPEKGVRVASVTVSANGFYVVSGRSLKEVENREATLFKLTVFGWALSLAVLLVVDSMTYKKVLRKNKRSRR